MDDPDPILIQFARVLGQESRAAKTRPRTEGEWRAVLSRMVNEIAEYVEANIHTDPIHETMIHGALCAAEDALTSRTGEDRWAAYCEAITRLAFLLMGDYPDHRRRSKGARRADHYSLKRFRTIVVSQDPEQRFRWLHAAKRLGELDQHLRDAYASYRKSTRKVSHKGFLRWFRERFPEEHSKVF